MEITMPEWTLNRLIPARSICMLFSTSNSGKSHLICDMIVSMMVGQSFWQEHEMHCRDVVMFLESQGYILARLKTIFGTTGKPCMRFLRTP